MKNLTVEGLLEAIERLKKEGHEPILLKESMAILPPNRPGYVWIRRGEMFCEELIK